MKMHVCIYWTEIRSCMCKSGSCKEISQLYTTLCISIHKHVHKSGKDILCILMLSQSIPTALKNQFNRGYNFPTHMYFQYKELFVF